jgi:flagellar biosynthesis/type III secretory pathway chaperone
MTANMTFDSATLNRQFELEIAALGRFIELLRAEQAALVHGETDQVAAFVEPKARQAFELARLDEERNRWLANLRAGEKTGNSRSAMERLLREHTGTAAALNSWHQLLKLAESARQINTTNGILIASCLQNTQRALSALFSVARLPGAYGANGGTVSLRTAQHLAVA